MNAWIPAFAGMTTLGGNGDHLLAFCALACTGLMAYPKRPAILLAGLLAYGGMIEVLQSLTPDRMAEWADRRADALGLAVGWGGEKAWIPACAGMTGSGREWRA